MAIFLGIVFGFVALIGGGELLVRGASNLAAAARVSPLIIGLTVVAFGTSAPELAVSVMSCYEDKTDLAVGNAVGSNITNLLLILGLSALAAPLAVSARLFRLDLPVMLAAAVLLWVLARDGDFNWIEGVGCLLLMVVYLVFTVVQGRRESGVAIAEVGMAELEITYDPAKSGWRGILVNLVWLILGLVLLILGADWVVDACVRLAAHFGVSDLVVGLTVVAIGTSLPELVTSVMASLRGQRDLAVGNVVGSNIFNILLVLGLSALVAPRGIQVDAQSLAFDIPVMTLCSLAALPVFFSGLGITRVEGGSMVVYYLAYLGYLVWHASRQPVSITTLSETALFLAPLVPFVVMVMVWGRGNWGEPDI